MKFALIIVDMLNDFIKKGAPLEVPLGRKAIGPIRRLLDKARHFSIPVIYICDRHLPSDPEFEVWPKHAVVGTEGADVVEELAPKEEERVIPKRRYSGFFGTDLDLTLRELAVGKLIITGVLTNICVLYSTVDAAARGYKVAVPQDCVAALSEEDNKWAFKNMHEVVKAEITTSDKVETVLSRRQERDRAKSEGHRLS